MKLLDFFKRKKNSSVSEKTRYENVSYGFGSKFTIRHHIERSGNRYIRMDYTDYNSASPNNSTRLIVKREPNVLQSKNAIYSAAVSWYNDEKRNHDKYMLYDIYLGLDIEKLAVDKEYQKVLMTQLLDKDRVMQIISQSPRNFHRKPNYVGEVKVEEVQKKYESTKTKVYSIDFNEDDKN